MIKKFMMFAAAATLLISCSKPYESKVVWESLGNGSDESGAPVYTHRFTVDTDKPFDRLAFCMFKRNMQPVNHEDTIIELLPGYFAIGSPRFAQARPGEPIVVEIVTNGVLNSASFMPDGVHLVADGKPVRVAYDAVPLSTAPKMWRSEKNGDPMIYGDRAFIINDSLRSAFRPAPYMQIPTPKSVGLSGQKVAVPQAFAVRPVDDKRQDYYRAEIGADSVVVYTNSKHLAAVVAMLKRRMAESADADGMVPTAVIEDWADYRYRAFMLDVARNFLGKEDVKKILDLMARYGLNVLHFHLGDDEGWRLEIPALPELTAVGSRRGYTETDDVPFLKQIYSGYGNPDAKDVTANGYYTVAEYTDILNYADSLGIDVIPEFDTPGHSRAAIRAMEYRCRTTGDESLRLVEPGDTSVYTTAQGMHDNLMNPALDGPYEFWSIVFDGIADIYRQAGANLRSVHIGGDEVPRHAWDGSAAVAALRQEKGMEHQREVHAYFVERVARIAAEKGLKISGWQEIALNHSDDYDSAVVPVTESVNCWTSAGDKGRRIAEKGYPLILTNVNYLYFDQKINSHPEEPGLTWGGIVDEFAPLHATVDVLCDATPEVQANVAGISGTVFAETVRSRAMVERYLLPRLLGLAERAHNSHATISDSEYFGMLTDELQRWTDEGYCAIVRQPGIRLADGKVEMNDAYGMGEIRYTLDGSRPDRNSALYTGPFEAGDAKEVRARLFVGPSESSTSILYVGQ